jgi:hypothetical protein
MRACFVCVCVCACACDVSTPAGGREEREGERDVCERDVSTPAGQGQGQIKQAAEFV